MNVNKKTSPLLSKRGAGSFIIIANNKCETLMPVSLFSADVVVVFVADEAVEYTP